MAKQHTKVEYFRSEVQATTTIAEYSIQGKPDGTKICMCQINDNIITAVNYKKPFH
jgi:hypothetical protein